MLHNLYKCWYKLTSINLKVNTEMELNTIMFEKEPQINKRDHVWIRKLIQQ